MDRVSIRHRTKLHVSGRKAPRTVVRGGITISLVLAICLVVGLLAILAKGLYVSSPISDTNSPEPHSSSQTASAPSQPDSPDLYPVTIRKPIGPPVVDTGLTDVNGKAVTVSCSTCHATRSPNLENKTVADLNEFHGNLTMTHGSLSCLSCHNADDYDSLKLADGTRVEFTEVMTLCGQCHGPQMRDYNHGVHGGMNGYWDLTRGPRTKNNCIDCHHPHSPQFPKMQPTFKPKDRFLH